METYTVLRHFADSWFLVAMALFFLGVILWALRPGSRVSHRDTAMIPLRNDSADACKNDCENCKCGSVAAIEVPK